MRMLSLILLLLWSAVATAEALVDFDLRLTARSVGFPSYSAAGQMSLRHVGEQQYQAELSAATRLGSIQESSLFQWQDGRIVSQTYQSSNRFTLFSEQKNYRFEGDRVLGNVNGQSVDAQQPQLTDPLNRILAIGRQAQHHDRFNLHSISWRSPKTEQFHVTYRGLADTHLGQMQVVIVEQQGRDLNRYYYAADQHWLPILWQQHKDGRLQFEIKVEQLTLLR